MSSAGHLLSLVEGKAGSNTREGLRLQRRALAEARRYYREAAGGQAQMVYSLGMVVGAGGLALMAGLVGGTLGIPEIDDREFFGCLTAGAVGAVVSVMSRISTGRFSLDFEVGRSYLVFLGILRPLLGAIFGLALYFAVISGILDLFAVSPDGTARFYFLLVIAFLAGFSERWAQDMLVGTRRGARPAATREPEPQRPSEAEA